MNQFWLIGSIASQLQPEVALDRGADVRRSVRINPPASVLILMFHDVARRLGHALGIARSQKDVQENVVGFERGVGFQLAAPVAFFVLLGEEAIARAVNGGGNPAD